MSQGAGSGIVVGVVGDCLKRVVGGLVTRIANAEQSVEAQGIFACAGNTAQYAAVFEIPGRQCPHHMLAERLLFAITQ